MLSTDTLMLPDSVPGPFQINSRFLCIMTAHAMASFMVRFGTCQANVLLTYPLVLGVRHGQSTDS